MNPLHSANTGRSGHREIRFQALAFETYSPVKSLSEWTSEIARVFARGRTGTLELAKTVYAARRELIHGKWSKLWKQGHMPCSKRKAEQLVAIGESLGSLDANTCSHLPPAWSTLYHLARLDSPCLQRLIREERVQPALTLREAKDLVASVKGEPKKKEKPEAERRLNQFRKFVHRTSSQWSPGERHVLAAELRCLG